MIAIRSRMLRARGDVGISLVEVLISMALSLVVIAIVVSAFFGGSRLQAATSAESDGLADLRTTVERLGRDLRAARGIDTAATASTLSMWIDSNSDYLKQSSEVVTWSLTATSGGLFDVVRSVGGTPRTQSRLVVNALAFSYRATESGAALALPLTATSAPKVRIVTGTIEYDAKPGVGTKTRFTTFSERLRNVA